jgi:hypothetical protein
LLYHYIATSLHHYITTSLPRYIATSLHRYLASALAALFAHHLTALTAELTLLQQAGTAGAGEGVWVPHVVCTAASDMQSSEKTHKRELHPLHWLISFIKGDLEQGWNMLHQSTNSKVKSNANTPGISQKHW